MKDLHIYIYIKLKEQTRFINRTRYRSFVPRADEETEYKRIFPIKVQGYRLETVHRGNNDGVTAICPKSRGENPWRGGEGSRVVLLDRLFHRRDWK